MQSCYNCLTVKSEIYVKVVYPRVDHRDRFLCPTCFGVQTRDGYVPHDWRRTRDETGTLAADCVKCGGRTLYWKNPGDDHELLALAIRRASKGLCLGSK